MKEYLVRVYITKETRLYAESQSEAVELAQEVYRFQSVKKIRAHQIKNLLHGNYLKNFLKKVLG